MEAVLNLFLPLAIQLLVLFGLSQLIDRMVLRYLGRGWYLALTWPGVVVHELSHFIGCIITFTRVTRVELFHPHGNTLGMVEHVQTRNPIKNIIISIAPLFGVTFVMWLLTRWVLPSFYQDQLDLVRGAIQSAEAYTHFFSLSGAFISQYWTSLLDLLSVIDFGQWQTYVFLYLMVTLSSHAAPSNVDLKHTYFGVAGLGIMFFILIMIDRWLQTQATWTVVQWLSGPVYFLVQFLTIGIFFSMVSALIMGLLSLMGKFMKKGSI